MNSQELAEFASANSAPIGVPYLLLNDHMRNVTKTMNGSTAVYTANVAGWYFTFPDVLFYYRIDYYAEGATLTSVSSGTVQYQTFIWIGP